MDPNVTLKALDEALTAHETGDHIDDMAEHIGTWLAQGGFSPDWASFPLGASYYDCRAVSQGYPKRS